MPANVTPGVLALLLVAAFLAGVVDAIAGGGGLLTVPALASTGLPMHLVLGTNKGQSVWGSLAALVTYARAGTVDRRRALGTFPAGFLGSLGGAALVLLVPPATLRPVVLALLVAVGAVLALRRPGAPPRALVESPRGKTLAALGLALALGAYDGFFGPGTGTFLLMGSMFVLGEPMTRATADAKVVNFASNLAAVLLFARRGNVLWSVALPMAGAQFAGGLLGARIALKGGERTIRVVVLGVVTALVGRLAWQLLRGQ